MRSVEWERQSGGVSGEGWSDSYYGTEENGLEGECPITPHLLLQTHNSLIPTPACIYHTPRPICHAGPRNQTYRGKSDTHRLYIICTHSI